MRVRPTMKALAQPTPERILLLAMLPIGDTLFLTPTVQALRHTYPNARITMLTSGVTLSLAQRIPAVDEALVFPLLQDWAGLAAFLHMIWYLRSRHFDISVDFTSPFYMWLSWLCGIPTRTYMKFDRFWWFLPTAHRQWRSTHASQLYYDCASDLGLPPWREVDHVSHVALPWQARRDALAWLAAHGITDDERPCIVIQPGGAGLQGVKRWPASRFAQLADYLIDHHNAHVLLLGGSDEGDLAHAVTDAMRNTPLIAVGHLPLLTSMALVAYSDLYIGNDSGLLHAAAAVGAPYIGIYGPTSPANFRPTPSRAGQGEIVLPDQRCCSLYHFVGGDVIWHHQCCQGTCAALLTLSVGKVIAAAERVLSERHSEKRDEPKPLAPTGAAS